MKIEHLAWLMNYQGRSLNLERDLDTDNDTVTPQVINSSEQHIGLGHCPSETQKGVLRDHLFWRINCDRQKENYSLSFVCLFHGECVS